MFTNIKGKYVIILFYFLTGNFKIYMYNVFMRKERKNNYE